MELHDNPKGNYRFLTGIAPFSSGVIAMPGYEIVHVTLQAPQPLLQGFGIVDNFLAARGLTPAALCAMELRAPQPWSFAGFDAFNEGYVKLLVERDILVAGRNPIARTNVAPGFRPPAEPSLFAFSYTQPTEGGLEQTFVVAGAGDIRGDKPGPQGIIRPGETSPEALQEKAAFVMRTMQSRLLGLGVTWSAVTVANVYTIHGLDTYLVSEILAPMQQSAIQGVHWYYSRPPIEGLDFEMNVRGVRQEVRI
ncbi:MAG: RidA family protein [Chloroflexi bacterium]|nr:RidA family protein [Chloroflexota bacterium]